MKTIEKTVDFTTLASDADLQTVVDNLKKNGIDAGIAESGAQAKQTVLSLLPEGAEVMNMTSITLDAIGVTQEIMESGKYDAVKKKMASMDRKTQAREMRKLGAAPDFTVGSVHAITLDGKIFIASNTGSQLAAYVYGAGKVIWVIGAQKVVKDEQAARERIYNYVLPLESERANKAYNMTAGSFVSKLLIVNREVQPERIKVILVKEKLGF